MEDKKDSFDLCYRIAKSKIPKIQEQYIHYNPIGQDIYNLATLALSSPQPRHNFAPTSPQVRQLVELMGTGDYTIKELTEMCGFIDPKHFREGYIKPALRENAIERLFADRPNHPKQKYRLTEVAKEWKSANENS